MSDAPSPTASELRTPVLLIAMPQVQDPFFHKSLVLLLHHEEEGSVGLIVNRPTGIEVGEILSGMELSWGGEGDAPTWFGGPVQPQTGTVLFSPPEVDGEPETDGEGTVIPGVALTQHLDDLGRLARRPPPRFRLLLGHAGWGAGQLMEEILRNDWLTAPATADLVFAGDPEAAWAEALASVGVDPDTLPSWTADDDGSSAN